MGDDFEASVKAPITPDYKFIKKNDEVINAFVREKPTRIIAFIVGLCLTAGAFFINWIAGTVFAVISLLLAWNAFMWLRKRLSLRSKRYMRELYTEGLLVPGMIVKTAPLTIMAVANITVHDNAPVRNAFYTREVEHLPGVPIRLYEKVPCSCFFLYFGGDYHDSFDPHPLCWATENYTEIRAAIQILDNEQSENYEDEWEVLKRFSRKFPDLKNDTMLLTDEQYNPLGVKHYLEDDYDPIVTGGAEASGETGAETETGAPEQPRTSEETTYSRYPKNGPIGPHITDDIPATPLYNAMIDSANKYQVYEYISTSCPDEDYSVVATPGNFFTYISDPVPFIEALDRRKAELTDREYPLMALKYLVTNKGCWDKKKFIPWAEAEFEVKQEYDNDIEVYVNGKRVVDFEIHTEHYANRERFSNSDLHTVWKLEADRLQRFLKELRTVCMTKF